VAGIRVKYIDSQSKSVVQHIGRSLSAKISVLRVAWCAKKVWSSPKRAKLLLFDRNAADVFANYLDSTDVAVLDNWRDSINMRVVARMLLRFGWRASRAKYERCYIELVAPSVVLTFIDNNTAFYRLKTDNPKLTTIFVQNGIRSEFCVFGRLRREPPMPGVFRVDYMLCFGTAVGALYRRYIDGEPIAIGSFRNNLYPTLTTPQRGRDLLFISQYRNPPSDAAAPLFVESGQAVTFDRFFALECKLLPQLLGYCRERGMLLKICGSSSRHGSAEAAYFASLLGDAGWEFLPRSGRYSSYDNVDAAAGVVFADSTLGYEALARGRRTAAFSVRGDLLGLPARNFGWPAALPDRGPFWSNSLDDVEVRRVLDFICDAGDEAWLAESERYATGLIAYDVGNSRFRQLMTDLGVPLKSEAEIS
jgi:surface carbohydrate biosynthesis protein